MTDRLDLSLKEYDAVFTELRQCIVTQYTVLGAGLAVAAAVLKEEWIALLSGQALIAGFLGLTLSGLSVLILTAWTAEVRRMRRNAMYLIALEKDLISATETSHWTPQFGFHTWARARARQGQLILNYVIIFGAFVVLGCIGFLPSVLAAIKYSPVITSVSPEHMPLLSGVTTTALVALAAFAVIVFLLARSMWRVDEWPPPTPTIRAKT